MSVWVVMGPPASGKSTWIAERAKPGDITIDYDALAQALSPGVASDPAEQPKHLTNVVMAARSAAIDEVTYGNPTSHDVYLVHSMPGRQHLNIYRKHGFEVITIDPGHDVCMQRAMAERTPKQVAQVQEWYERRGLTA